MTTEAEYTLMEVAVSVKPSGRYPNGSELHTAHWTRALGMQSTWFKERVWKYSFNMHPPVVFLFIPCR
jgi:hypothetical protein